MTPFLKKHIVKIEVGGHNLGKYFTEDKFKNSEITRLSLF